LVQTSTLDELSVSGSDRLKLHGEGSVGLGRAAQLASSPVWMLERGLPARLPSSRGHAVALTDFHSRDDTRLCFDTNATANKEMGSPSTPPLLCRPVLNLRELRR
jgi:hypothetical protein